MPHRTVHQKGEKTDNPVLVRLAASTRNTSLLDNGDNDDSAAVSKRVIHRFGRLLKDIYRESFPNTTPDAMARYVQEVEGQMAVANQVIDAFVEIGQELGTLKRADEVNVVEETKTTSSFQPVYTIHDEKDLFEVKVELPGVTMTDVSIQLLEGEDAPTSLSIRGPQRSTCIGLDSDDDDDEQQVFTLRIPMDDTVNTKQLEAKLELGILTIRAPKKERREVVSRGIPIS